MSHRNIAQSIVISIYKISHRFNDYFLNVNRDKWVNGRPVLLNGDVWCLKCETWHVTNTLCQQ